MTHLNDLARHSGNGHEFFLHQYYGTWTCTIRAKANGVEVKIEKRGDDKQDIPNTPQGVYDAALKEFDRVCFSGAKELNPMLTFEHEPYAGVERDHEFPV